MNFKYIDKRPFFDWQLHHLFYFDVNEEGISWVIQTSDSTIKQNRKHAGIYKNKVTDLQSKYTGLHVELF